MKLNRTDFTGEGAKDFKFGFRMPLSCKNSTHCHWICQNMVKHDGISNKTIESEQNVQIEDLENDDDQQFESDLVVVDESDNEDLEDMNQTNVTDVGRRRVLADEQSDISMVYADEGYEADADDFESGVVVDDPVMAETINVPEDQRDPDVDYRYKSDEPTFSIWWFIAGGLTTIALFGLVTYFCMDKFMNKESE